MQRISLLVTLLSLSLVTHGLTACSSTPSLGNLFGGKSEVVETEAAPAETLFKEGDAFLVAGSYEKAAARFEEVDKQHPYSPFARRAIVMASWAHFKRKEYTHAVAAAKRYTTLHPGTKEAALAQHIIASSYFDQINNPQHDQTDTRKALKELQTLVRRYPNSRYVAKARNRILIARDVLAAKDMTVGRYYLKKRNYLAGINRFKAVIQNYQTTKHVEEALYRLVESYMALGITNEAQNAAAVLGHNFPQSSWYKDAYTLLSTGGLSPKAYGGSWLSTTLKNVAKLSPF